MAGQLAFPMDELVVDLFAGGGGASLGIERGIGRPVDIAVNHDPEAVAMHQANHPHTQHFCESVFAVPCTEVTQHRQVGLLWASPDCTHHSKAKGGKPVSTKRRGLAWVVIRWARRCRPRVIMLENVEEFEDWGPVAADGRPCRHRRGDTFRQWVHQLERCGYRVEWRQLRACDYGTPTIRKRLFVIARRDGLPIVWPQPTHGPADALNVRRGRLQPYRTAAECIDWSIPCPSIFARKRPLAENTLRRIARGVHRFVLDCPQPFIVSVNHTAPWYDQFRGQGVAEPLQTVTGTNGRAIVVPTLVQTGYGERPGQAPRAPGLGKPLGTVVAGGAKHALVAAFLAKHYGGNYTGPGIHPADPIATVTTTDHHALVAAHITKFRAGSVGSDARDPLHTVTAAHSATRPGGAAPLGAVAAFLAPYYSSGSGETGRDLRAPAPTATTRDRLQLVVVHIDGSPYVIADIGMRMLQPRELFRAQGFPDEYVINPIANGRPLPKHAQVRMCGNSVPPQWPEALVRANFAHERRAAA